MDKGFQNIDQLFEAARNEQPVVSFEETKRAFDVALLSGVSAIGLAKIFNFKYGIIMFSASAIIVTSAILMGANLSASDEAMRTKNTTSVEGTTNVWNEELPMYGMDFTTGNSIVPGDSTKRQDTVMHYEGKDMSIYVISDTTENGTAVSKIIQMNNDDSEDPFTVIVNDSEGDQLQIIQRGEGDNGDQLITINEETSLGQLVDIIDLAIQDELRGLEIEVEDLNIDLEDLADIDIDLDDLDDEIQVYMDGANIIADGGNIQVVQARYPEPEYEGELTTVVHTITENTKDEELQKIIEEAGKAGVDIRYNNRVKGGKIKRLNMSMKLTNGNSQSKVNHYIERSRGESFSINIVWRQDEKGNAIDFGKSESRSCTRVCN